jgi:glycosyltransferase involved in cell wall biosynthesis
MSPTISIVIPVYNRSSYLGAAIESVLGQTRRDFELIIWDDGSTDNSVNIACHYAKQDERVRVVAAEHQGTTLSLKTALSMTTGTYIGWVDSDDLLAATALEETAAALDANLQVGLVYTNYVVIDENNNVIGPGQRCRIPYSPEQLLLNFMIFHFRLMRRCVYEQVDGIDPNSGLIQDYDLCLRLSEVTEIQQLKRPLYYYRNHSGNISHQKRIELIYNSQEAIARALQRRGLADRYEIKVEIIGHYYLQPKNEA